MAGSVNKVILVGNLGADPEIKAFQSGDRIANVRIATSESWTDKASGEPREKTEWHSITLEGDGPVRVAEQYLRKGSKIYVEGKLQTRKWQDRDGNDRYTTEIRVGFGGQMVMLSDNRSDDQGHGRGDDRGYGRGEPQRGVHNPPRGGDYRYDRQGTLVPAAEARRRSTAPASVFDDFDDDVPF